MYEIPIELVQRVTKSADESGWCVLLECGHFITQTVVLFERHVYVFESTWFGWLPGSGAVGVDAPLPAEVKLTTTSVV
jgi:hypothetical protein